MFRVLILSWVFIWFCCGKINLMEKDPKGQRYRYTGITLSASSLRATISFIEPLLQLGLCCFLIRQYSLQKQATALRQPLSTQQPVRRSSSREGSLNSPVLPLHEEINLLSLVSVNNSTFMIRSYLLGERTSLLQKSMLPESQNIQKPERVLNYPSVSTEKEMFLNKYLKRDPN